MEFIIKIYKTSNGKCPFDEWLNNLKDKKAKVIIDLRVERIRLGNLGQCKLLVNSLYELKIDFGPGYRIYFTKIGQNIVLLLCAGDKKTQQKDIDKAKKYLNDLKNLEILK